MFLNEYLGEISICYAKLECASCYVCNLDLYIYKRDI